MAESTDRQETVALPRGPAAGPRSAPPDVPAQVGPFQLQEMLGQGGNGTVHRAVHRDTGQVAAVKTVRRPRAGELAFLRREIQSLARLDHPGIVRILDHGVEGGLPWYAMELVAGSGWRALVPPPVADPSELETCAPSSDPHAGNSATWWTETSTKLSRDDAPGTPAGPPTPHPRATAHDRRPLLTLVRRLCGPLAYIHGEGIVHRDLKPENVIVRTDGTPVIVDFGLVEQTGSRESLDATARVAGTILYMAPEQGQGRLVDARADLYALGCMLFELLTGRPPFVAANAMAVFRMHQRAEPEPPSRLVAGIAPELDRLVLRLLAKDPRDRYGYADDVAAALLGLGAEDDAAPATRARPYVYRASLAGRAALLDTLRAPFAAEGGSITLLGGPEGSGRTRLLTEMAAWAGARDYQLLAGSCPPVEPAEPMGAFRGPLQAIADACRERGEAETRRILGSAAPLFARYEPAFRDLPGVAGDPAPPELGLASSRLRLFGSVARVLRAVAEGPLLLLLDDLQWADELSLELLLFLARAVDPARRPVHVLGTHRLDPVPPMLSRLRQTPGVRTVEVQPLGEADIGQVAADMLALPAAPSALTGLLAAASAGSPFYVAEYLRLAVEEEIVRRRPGGSFDVLPDPASGTVLPASLRDLVTRRLRSLDPAARGVLSASAVLAPLLDEAMLPALSGLDQAELDRAVDVLLARQLLVASKDGRLGFANELVRQVADAELDEPARVRLHRAAAALLEERGAPASRLAEHYQRGGDVERAIALHLEAARRAFARHGLAAAEASYRSALGLMARPSEERASARLALAADVLRRRGRTQEALAELDLGLADALACGAEEVRVRCLAEQGDIHRGRGDADLARALLEDALDRARSLGSRRLEGSLLSRIGAVDLDLGEHEAAARSVEAALAIHAEDGDLQAEGGTWGALGNVRLTQSRIDDAARCFERARQLAIEAGDRRNEGSWTANLGNVAYARGRLDEAHRFWELGLAIAREVGDRNNESILLGNLAIVHEKRLELDAASHLHEEALLIAREMGDTHGEIHRLLNWGAAMQELGHLSKARDLFERVVRLGGEVGDRRLRGVALSNLGSLLVEMGLLPEARTVLGNAVAAHREIGDPVLEAITLSRTGDELLARGRPHEARPILERAAALSSELGDGKQEGMVRLTLAILERTEGRLPAAAVALDRAEELLETSENPLGVALCIVERGFHEVAAGRDGGPALARAESLRARGFTDKSRLARAIAELRKALARGTSPGEAPGASGDAPPGTISDTP